MVAVVVVLTCSFHTNLCRFRGDGESLVVVQQGLLEIALHCENLEEGTHHEFLCWTRLGVACGAYLPELGVNHVVVRSRLPQAHLE